MFRVPLHLIAVVFPSCQKAINAANTPFFYSLSNYIAEWGFLGIGRDPDLQRPKICLRLRADVLGQDLESSRRLGKPSYTYSSEACLCLLFASDKNIGSLLLIVRIRSFLIKVTIEVGARLFVSGHGGARLSS